MLKEKNKRFKERGITLIALVITIIVLLILAGVALSALTGDSGLLINAESAKEETREAALKEKIQLALSEYKLEKVKNPALTISEFFENKDGFDNAVYNENTKETTITLSNGKKYTIDENGVFIENGGNSGAEEPAGPELNPDDGSTPTEGTIYTYGDYQYCYGLNWCVSGNTWSSMCPQGMCGCYSTTSGWAVRCTNNIANPGPILETINGKPITSLNDTFFGCTELTTAPAIPSTVTEMQRTFYGCTSLTDKGMPTIPENTTSLMGTFSSCASLTDLSSFVIPNNVTMMEGTFSDCSSLEKAPVFPNGVESLAQTFSNCSSLVTVPEIPASVRDMNGTFQNCTALKNVPAIPNGVTTMIWTFSYCTGLEIAPIIPSTVTDMQGTFEGCNNLKSYVGSTDLDGDLSGYIIPNGVTNMHTTFENCGLLTVAPNIPNGVIDMSRTFSGCSSLRTASEIPSTVTQMYGTFEYCYSLTGVVTINANPIEYGDCFKRVSMSEITLAGTSTMLNELKATGQQ